MDFSKMHSAVGLSVMNCNRETSRCYWENIGRKFCARNCEFLINFPKHLKLLEKMKCINVRDSLRLFFPNSMNPSSRLKERSFYTKCMCN